MKPSPDDRSAELRELFFETSQELLQALNEQALQLEKTPSDAEVVRDIRRTVHTLKGDAAACGFADLSDLAHELEDVLALETGETAHAEVAELALSAADLFAGMLDAFRKKKKVPPSEPLRKRIERLAAQPGKKTRGKKAASGLHFAWTEYEQLAIRNAVAQARSVYQVSAQIDPHCAMPVAARQLVHNALQSVGEVLAIRPEPGARQAAKLVEAALASELTPQQIGVKCQIPSIVSKVRIEVIGGSRSPRKPVAAAGTSEAAAPTIPEASAPASPIPTAADSGEETDPAAAPVITVTGAESILRVDAERIDAVLNLVGELIIGKSMLHQAVQEFGRRFGKDPLRNRLSDAVALQARVLNDLQRAVMKIRMVPVEQLFRRFPRIVRDVSRQCGKQVELVLSGQHTDLDKTILDALAEPLTHMVRNAVSHGIESSAERQGKGKPANGTITLDAYHHGNQVIVEVKDDGRGIDVARIRSKAVEMGLVKPGEAGRLSEGETLEFIFRPGFSTAEEITAISGRGVGMDVVQSVLHRMKAAIMVETRAGEGTTFRLKLPLTLAIIKALMFMVEDRLYAIPLNAVAEIARATAAEIHRVDNYEVLQRRNQVLPLVRLGHFSLEDPAGPSRKIFVLVTHVGEKKFGLLVDELVGEEELVIKALDDQVVATDLVSGASILGDGRVVLILNLAAIVERTSRSRPDQAGDVASGLLLSHSPTARGQAPDGTGVRA